MYVWVGARTCVLFLMTCAEDYVHNFMSPVSWLSHEVTDFQFHSLDNYEVVPEMPLNSHYYRTQTRVYVTREQRSTQLEREDLFKYKIVKKS